MKLIAKMALLGLLGISGAAVAQDQPAAGGGDQGGIKAAAPEADNTQYKAKTVYDFEDDMVEGDLQRPDGELVNALKKTEHSSLIEIRKDFIPEMLKSLEDI